MFVEVLVLPASGVIMFHSAAKHLILVESAMGTILVAMRVKILVLTVPDDFWMPAEFAAGITNHAQGVTAFWFPLKYLPALVWGQESTTLAEFVGVLVSPVQVVTVFRSVVRNLIFAEFAILPSPNAIFAPSFQFANKVPY
jgi:hypothetical protein